MQFLHTLNSHDEILVCGHSLGGCLATVMALYLKDELPDQAIHSVPFAGQTAGNGQFADWYATTSGAASRWANCWDVVPKLWNHTNLEQIKSLYPGGPQAGDIIKGAVDVVLDAAGDHYFQPGPGTLLNGKLYSESGLLAFEEEIGAQHDSIHYLYLTGIPLSVIQGTPSNPGLGSDWWPPGKNGKAGMASRS